MSILISTLAAGFQMPEKIMWYHIAILVGAVVVLGLLIWGLVKYTKRQVRRSHLYTYEKQKEVSSTIVANCINCCVHIHI